MSCGERYNVISCDCERLQADVHAKLTLRWSPEQITKWLVTAYPDDATMRVSHETIYAYLYVLPGASSLCP